MEAVVEISGKQYLISEGQTLRVPRQDAEKGGDITIDKVLFARDGATVWVDKVPVTVKAHIVAHELDKKIRVFKHHAKKRYRRTQGHRQAYTEIKITSIAKSK